MVEALQQIAHNWACVGGCTRLNCEHNIARRALSTWDTRGRLRNDREFVSLILDYALSNHISGRASAQEFADTIDTAVLGTPRQAPTGGET